MARLPDIQIRRENPVSIVWEDVDIEEMKTVLSSTEDEARKAKHTVIDRIEIYIEIDGGS